MKFKWSINPITIKTRDALLASILVMATLLPGWSVPGLGEGEQQGSLVRIYLGHGEGFDPLVDLGFMIYARLYDDLGQPYLLAHLDAEQVESTRRAGYLVKILDQQAGDSSYYLVHGIPGELSQMEAVFNLIEVGEQEAVVKIGPGEEDQLYGYDVMVSALVLHPLVIPLETRDLELEIPVMPDPLIQKMIDQVDRNNLSYKVGSLSGEWEVMINDLPYVLYTRYTYADSPIKKATRYAYERLAATGLPVGYDTYYISGVEKRNVVAEQAGLTEPGRIILLTAHLDSISQSPYDSAPGADDNASGSSALIHIAEILSQYDFGCTLRYVLFTGEEQGYLGSRDYAADVRAGGENIEAVLNLDMLGYNTPGSPPTIEVHTRPDNAADLEIATLFAQSISAYGIDLTPLILRDGKSFSDHSSFWEQGYPAIMAIEDWSDHTPQYHKTTDSLQTLEMDYYHEFARAAISTFAHVGCLLRGEVRGKVTDAETGNPIPGAYIEARMDNGWILSTNSDLEGNYILSLFPGSYAIWASAAYYTRQEPVAVTVSHEQTLTRDVVLQVNSAALLASYLPLLHLNSP